MKRKILRTGAQARNSLIQGAKTLAEAVRMTLGPFALSAAIEKGDEVIDDGVTVAREIVSGCIPDEIEHRGARLLMQVATKTEDIAGDGTTTSIILAHEITKEAKKFLADENTFASKKRPSEVVAQIEKECKEITDKLVGMAKPIENEDDLVSVTTVSASDPELGSLIGKAQWALGKDGFILAEETAERNCSVQEVHGIKIDNGFGTSLLLNNQEKQSLDIKDTRVLLTNYVLQDLQPIKELGQQLAKIGVRSLAIVARGFAENAIRDCIANIEKGFAIYPINAPYTDQNEVMKDMASILGGSYINSEEMTLENVQVSDIGYAEKIVARRYDAIFTGRESEKIVAKVTKRVEELKQQLAGVNSDFTKKNIETRIAQLTHGFAIVKIGAVSEIKRKYLKRKSDDAVGASRAALQEGVVAGGGLAFKEIAESLPDDYILKYPLMSIHEQIMASAPIDFVIKDSVKDAVKVLRIALEQACSVASIFATSGIAIAEEKMRPMDLALRRLADTSKGQDEAL